MERREGKYLNSKDLFDVEVQVGQIGEGFDGKPNLDAVVSQTFTQTAGNQNIPTVGKLFHSDFLHLVKLLRVVLKVSYWGHLVSQRGTYKIQKESSLGKGSLRARTCREGLCTSLHRILGLRDKRRQNS